MPASTRWELPLRYREVSATYGEALGILAATKRLGISPLLETVIAMLDELRRPDAAFRVIQIAGTNGKTSTSRYTAAILAGEGLRVALYTSPELVSMTERMEIAGKPVSEEAFAHGIAVAHAAGEVVNERQAAAGERPFDITEFDLLTVAALVVFAEAEVDVAVLEVGMGGRWDATTATNPEVTAITGIGLDHTAILGDTLPAIAAEKAAVIRRGQRACILGAGCHTEPCVRDVLEERAASERVPFTSVLSSGQVSELADLDRYAEFVVDHAPTYLGDRLLMSVNTPFWSYEGIAVAKPAYQAQNIACAMCVAEAFLRREVDEEVLCRSVAACPTPGRFELLRADPPQLVDACHNPQSVEAFLASYLPLAGALERPMALLFACFGDKDCDSMIELVGPVFDRIYVTRTAASRSLEVDELASRVRAHGFRVAGTFPSVDAACSALAREPFVALGTITLAGEVTDWQRFHS